MKVGKYFSFAVLLGCLVASDVSGQDVTNGLIGYYPFDGNANDLSGKGLHGTVNGATLAEGINGEANTCYDFTNGNIEVLHNITLPDTSLTISMWFYVNPTNLYGATLLKFYSSNEQSSYSNFSLDSHYPFDELLWPTCTLNVCKAETNCSYTNYAEEGIKKNEWYHIVYSFNRDTAKVYVNEVELKLGSQTGSAFIKEELLYQKLQIASGHGVKIDDLMIFNRVLSSNERTTLFRKKSIIVSVTENSFMEDTKIFYSHQNQQVVATVLKGEINQVELVDINGKIVFSSFPNSSSILIDSNSMKSGVYFIKLQTTVGVEIKKICIIH